MHLPILQPNSILPPLPSAVDSTLIAQAIIIIIIIPRSLSHASSSYSHYVQCQPSTYSNHIHTSLLCSNRSGTTASLAIKLASLFDRGDHLRLRQPSPRGTILFSWYGAASAIHFMVRQQPSTLSFSDAFLISRVR